MEKNHIIYFILIHLLVKHPIVKWLSSTQAAITSIASFTFMVLCLGFIPQGGHPQDPSLIDSLGLSHVTSSWPYLMSALYLLIVLGFTIVRRFNNFTIRNISFLLNHIGLWIVVVAASLGSADMWKLSMQLETNHPVMTAYDSKGNAYNMGFGMMLTDFQIDEYPPEIGLMRNNDHTLMLEKGGKLMVVEEGANQVLEGFTLDIEKYLPYAKKYEQNVYDTSSLQGSARAAYVKVKDENAKLVAEGWVSDGSYSVPPAYVVINTELSVAMTQIRPKKYASDIRMYHTMDEFEDFHIEVNKPFSIDGWKIYQVGYDEQMGRWSEKSVIELVRDPWLPIVYIGIFMMLIGSLYLLWMGKGRIKTKKA